MQLIYELPLGHCCDQTGCQGRGADGVLSPFSCPSSSNCANECQNRDECVGYYHFSIPILGSYCALYRGYVNSQSTRFYSCDSELWTAWVDDQCSVTCGVGSKQRTRYCCGSSCTQDSESTTDTCDTYTNCPIDGGWTIWSSYDSCSVTCGGGIQTRSRQCTNPEPQDGGADCPGDDSETQSCNTQNCPIDGGWTTWSTYSSCSLTCGGGIQTRSRQCTNPEPQHGGSDCPGDDSETQSCNTQNCPIDGGWTTWSTYSSCSLTCGGGIQTRSRQCTNPEPQHGGSDCPGDDSETQSCNTQNCPIDGGWTVWSNYGSCSVTCGGGIQTRSRQCTNPEPQDGGSDCPGDDSETQSCNTQNCPIDGGWATWSAYQACSVTCGGGIQSRSRTCSNPSPQHGGASCVGSNTETQICSSQNCPINGGWSSWVDIENCSATCGPGFLNRSRTCTDPEPQYGGDQCVGQEVATVSCTGPYCPIDGAWSTWTSFSMCPVSCGGGIQYRNRSCNHPAPQYNGDYCVGNDAESQACNTVDCPVDGGWSIWTGWGSCNVTCGGGTQSRSRSCSNPYPQYGGTSCSGESENAEVCNNHTCPADGGPECRCICVEKNITLEAKIEQMKNELTINRTQLSSTRRKLVCAEDPRTSATSVGLIGMSFICALGIFLISGDFLSAVTHIFRCRK